MVGDHPMIREGVAGVSRIRKELLDAIRQVGLR